MKITLTTNRRLHAVLRRLGITDRDQIADMVEQATKGRTQSRKELTELEARGLIRKLNETQKDNAVRAQRMRRKIIAMAHELGWQRDNALTGQRQADIERIDRWLTTYSGPKKPLKELTDAKETSKVVTQFENMYLSIIKGKSNG